MGREATPEELAARMDMPEDKDPQVIERLRKTYLDGNTYVTMKIQHLGDFMRRWRWITYRL